MATSKLELDPILILELEALENTMYLEGDKRSDVISRVLDNLVMLGLLQLKEPAENIFDYFAKSDNNL